MIHSCPEKLTSVDGECVTIRMEEPGVWSFDGSECSGGFVIFFCPFCGVKLDAIDN